jgi:hypothetical protein
MTARGRLVAVAVIVALAALALIVVLVFAFGRHNPTPPSLKSHPNPAIPGEILFLDNDGCLVRAAASGASRQEAYCLGQPNSPMVAWIDAQTVAVATYDGKGPAWTVIDLATKTERPGVPLTATGFNTPSQRSLVSPQGETVVANQQDGTISRITGGVRTEIAKFDVRKYGGPIPLTWSPDGQWILLQYYSPRGGDGQELWIISRDGSFQGTLATGAAGAIPSWRIEGVGVWPQVDGLPSK